jgi:hypothetical protein
MAHFHTSMYYSYYNLFVVIEVATKPKIIVNTCLSEYLYKQLCLANI